MLKTILLISCIASFVFAAVVSLIMFFYLKKIKKVTLNKMQLNEMSNYQNAFLSENFGTIIWELKSQSKNPLEDIQLAYAVSTIMRNNYQTSCVVGFDGQYENESLIKLGKQKIDCQSFDFLLINASSNLKFDLQNFLPKLNHKGIIFVSNVKKQFPKKSQIIEYLKKLNLRYESQKIGQGIFLITK